MRIPPLLTAPMGQAERVRALGDAAVPLVTFLQSLPSSSERDEAAKQLNGALLWAHQCVVQLAPSRIELPQ